MNLALGDDGAGSLHAACEVGDLQLVRLLAKRFPNDDDEEDDSDSGAGLNSRDESGWTPLHWAICEKHSDVVAFLLSLPHIDACAVTAHGLTAIDLAEQDYRIVDALRSHVGERLTTASLDGLRAGSGPDVCDLVAAYVGV
jgi:ankyrin repeat protein